jgi:hypothetical protein
MKMGKITSIYLNDEETTELKKFCEENACSQYKAIKIAMKELFSKQTNKQTETEKKLYTKKKKWKIVPNPEKTIKIIRNKPDNEESKTEEEKLIDELLQE